MFLPGKIELLLVAMAFKPWGQVAAKIYHRTLVPFKRPVKYSRAKPLYFVLFCALASWRENSSPR